MTEYATLLSGVCLLSAVARLLSSGGALKKVTDAAISVVLLLSVLRGAILLAESMDPSSVTLPDIEYEDIFVSGTEESLETAIGSAVSREFGIGSDEIVVVCDGVDIKTLRAKLITVTLFGEAALSDYRRVRDFVNSLDHGECEVRIRFDGED